MRERVCAADDGAAVHLIQRKQSENCQGGRRLKKEINKNSSLLDMSSAPHLNLQESH